MKCSSCGAAVVEGTKFCGMCGRPFEPPAVSPGASQNRFCVKCGRALSWDANVCQYCGHDFRASKADPSRDHLVIGGVLTLLAGIFSIALTTLILADMWRIDMVDWAFAALVYCCAIAGVLGGMLALTRSSFPFSVFGAACAVFGPGFFFGIPGLVLITKSARAFDRAPAERK